MRKLFKLIRSKTPQIGKKIAKIGLGLLGISIAPEIPIIQEGLSTLPEIPQSWIEMLRLIFAIIGAGLTFLGYGSTEENPDEIVKEK